MFCVFAAAAALLAAHLAFMAAASCARRSGVRLSFLFTFLAVIGLLAATARIRGSGVKRRFFFSARPEVSTLLRALSARTADFLFFLAAPAVAAASSFCFSFASFFAPFCRRASSRRIFLLRFLGFIWGSILLPPVAGATRALDMELITKFPNVTSYYSAIEIGLYRFCRKKIAKMFVDRSGSS